MAISVTAQKLNISGTQFDRLPLAFMGKSGGPFADLTPFLRCVLGHIHTENTKCKGNARITYEDFMQWFGTSRATIANALKALKEKKLIEAIEQSRYRILPAYSARKNLIVDSYLYIQKFDDGNGVLRRLPRGAVQQYALINNHEQKTAAPFKSSARRLATALNMPKSTVEFATRRLLKAGLLNRAIADGKDYTNNESLNVFTCAPEYLAIRRCAPTRDELASLRKEYRLYLESEALRTELQKRAAFKQEDIARRLDLHLRKTDPVYAALVNEKHKNLDDMLAAQKRGQDIDGILSEYERRAADTAQRLQAHLQKIGVNPDALKLNQD